MVYGGSSAGEATPLGAMCRSGEGVLWEGRPIRAKYIWRLWPVSCFGAMSAVIPTLMALFTAGIFWFGRDGNLPLPPTPPAAAIVMVVLPFFTVAAVLVVGPLVISALMWPNVEYALTNQRVLIRSGLREPVVSATELADVTGISVRGESVGTIVFHVPGTIAGALAPLVAYRRGFRRIPAVMSPTFEAIADVQVVCRIAQEALHAANQR